MDAEIIQNLITKKLNFFRKFVQYCGFFAFLGVVFISYVYFYGSKNNRKLEQRIELLVLFEELENVWLSLSDDFSRIITLLNLNEKFFI